jgi:hypothetical protein
LRKAPNSNPFEPLVSTALHSRFVAIARAAISVSSDASLGKFAELIEIVAAIDDARIDERRGFGWHAGSYPPSVARVNAESV